MVVEYYLVNNAHEHSSYCNAIYSNLLQLIAAHASTSNKLALLAMLMGMGRRTYHQVKLRVSNRRKMKREGDAR